MHLVDLDTHRPHKTHARYEYHPPFPFWVILPTLALKLMHVAFFGLTSF
jgi:hypothetical protein